MAANEAYLGLPPLDAPSNPANARQARVFLATLRRDPPSYQTDNRWEQSAHYTSVAYIAIRAIANAMAGTSIQVLKYRRGLEDKKGFYRKSRTAPHAQSRDQDYHPVSFNDPLAIFFEHINPIDTFSDFMTQWTIQQNLTGNVYVWVVRNTAGFPVEMWILPTALCQYVPLSVQYPCGGLRVSSMMPYMMGSPAGNSGGFVVPAEDVLRYQEQGPLYRWDGYSKLTAMGRELDALDGITTSRKASMDRGTNMDAVVSLAGASVDECQRVQSNITNKHGGAENHHKVFVTNAEDMNVDLLSHSPKDMDYPSGWDQLVKASLAGFGVPSAIAGLTESPAYAAYYASLLQFYGNNLEPLCRSIGQFLTKHLARKVDRRYSVQIDIPPINDKDQLEKQIGTDVGAGAITVNELRAIRDREPVEGGDVPPKIYEAQQQAAIQQKQQEEQAKIQAQQQQAMGGGMGGASMANPDPSQPPQGPSSGMGEGSLPGRLDKTFGLKYLDDLLEQLSGETYHKSKDSTGHEHRGKGPGQEVRPKK